MLLETYSALDEASLKETLPSFLQIEKEVTGNPDYSMFNLSLREDWTTSKKFCFYPSGPQDTPSHDYNYEKEKMEAHSNGLDCKKALKMNGHGDVKGKECNGKA